MMVRNWGRSRYLTPSRLNSGCMQQLEVERSASYSLTSGFEVANTAMPTLFAGDFDVLYLSLCLRVRRTDAPKRRLYEAQLRGVTQVYRRIEDFTISGKVVLSGRTLSQVRTTLGGGLPADRLMVTAITAYCPDGVRE